MTAQLSKENSKAIFDQIRSYTAFADVQVSMEGGVTCRLTLARNEVVDTLESQTVRIQVLLRNNDNQYGVSTCDSLDEQSLRLMVKRAEENALQSTPSTNNPIAAGSALTELPLWSDKTATLTWANRVELFIDSIKYCRANRYALNGYWEDKQWYQAVINTKGLMYYQASTPCQLVLQVNTTVNPGIGYQSEVAYDFTKIRPLKLTEVAAHKAQISTNGRTPAIGTEVEVLLEARAVKAILDAFLVNYLREPSQTSISYKRSVKTRVGLSSLLHISSNPQAKHYSFTPFTQQGEVLTNTTWIDNGQILHLPTQQLPWQIQAGGFTNEQLQQRISKGIVVANVQGLAFQNEIGTILTGCTTGGVFWVENGKVTTPIKNIRFQIDCVAFLTAITALGVEEVIDGSKACAILAPHFQLISVSDSY